MGTFELKTNLHKIIDEIKNEQLLLAIYDFLKVQSQIKPGNLWATISGVQKKEVLLAFEESENEKNLIEREKVFKPNK